VTAYQTTASWIHHLLKFDERYGPQPLVDLPWLAGPLTTLVTLLLVAAAVAAGWLVSRELPTAQGRLLRFGMLSALMIPLQPVGEEHSFVLLLPATLTALVVAVDAEPGTRRGLLVTSAALGAALLAVPMPFWDAALTPGWRALLAYPKLYGALFIAMSLAVALAAEPSLWRALAHKRLADLRAGVSALRPRRAWADETS
jgi:hypothetical protein